MNTFKVSNKNVKNNQIFLEIWVLMSLLLLHATSTKAQNSTTVHYSSSSSHLTSSSSSNLSSISSSILLNTILPNSTPVLNKSTEPVSKSIEVRSSTTGPLLESSQLTSSTQSPNGTHVSNDTDGLQSNSIHVSSSMLAIESTESTPPSQSICPVTAGPPCAAEFIDLFAKNKSDPSLPALQNQLLQGLHCDPTLLNEACAIYVAIMYPAENRQKCIKIKTATQSGFVVIGKPNQWRLKTFTRFALMCLGNHLVPIAWDPNACSEVTSYAINKTTRAMCSLAGNLSEGSNSTSHFNLFCKDRSSPDAEPDIDPVSLIAPWYIGLGCGGMAPTDADPSLFIISKPAITAMVVLISLAVICSLAAFFFWPKWQIRDPKLITKHKKKEREGMLNEGFDIEGPSGGAQYRIGKNKNPPVVEPLVV